MQQKKNTILTTSTANGRAAHTIPTLMKRITMMLALIVSFAFGARAADYVFTYTNGNYTYFLGESTTPTTSFVPNASIYTGNSGSTFRNANGYYIRYNNGLAFSKTTGTNFTINNQLAYYQFYLNINRDYSTWRISQNYDRLATANIVETETIITEFTISGDESISTTGINNTYTHSNATYYYAYRFNDKTYYSTDPADPASVTKPATGLSLPIGSYTWSISDNSYATVNASTGAITVNSLPTTDKEIFLTCSVTHEGKTQKVDKKITIIAPKIDPAGITAEDLTLPVDETRTIAYELQPSGAYRNVTFSVADATIATVNANGVVTGIKAGTTTVTLTAKKLNGETSPALTTTINVKVVGRCATPVITIDKSTGNTTITCSTEDATIYYTTDGSDPTESSSKYNGSFTVGNGVIVKAIAVKDGWLNSNIGSASSGGSGETASDPYFIASVEGLNY
ncbi:MAG: chitobiase/beta-hexosaminidase C-terminal domain-containing protein, partial [Bacteroidaceae bacterium]|nr:chitobiase/beta-hexosaminidase C-terminal domain-containing protein [Bacteroidaceae bacterium]